MSQKKTDTATVDQEMADAVAMLQDGKRRDRQNASMAIVQIARKDASRVVPFADAIAQGAQVEEARTRWQCLDALTACIDGYPEECAAYIPVAEDNLFDDESGAVHYAALHFITKIGSVSTELSKQVWPLIDEAMQMYHGDEEYDDMLDAIAEFASCDIDPEVKAGLAKRVAFDAANNKGILQKRAKRILDIVSE